MANSNIIFRKYAREAQNMKIAFTTSSLALIIFLLVIPRIVIGETQLLSMFFSGYDKAIRPDFGRYCSVFALLADKGTPINIFADIYVEAFGNIKEANMEYLVYGYFRQRWKESRLAGKLNYTLTIKGADIEKIWIPDSYCYNARESNMMMLDTQIHSKIDIDPNGDVFYSKGITLLASCTMNLRSFPLDSQSCCLKFGSYGYTTDDIIFKWGTKSATVGNNEMAQFEYISNNLTSGVDEYSVGNFSTITVTFLFERRVGFYLIQVYLPDVFVVALSWIVFWMDKTEMGDRMALGITTILTIMFLLGSMNSSMPKVSYAKALDWYLLVSFIFVFLSLIECMVVFILTKKYSEKKEAMKHKLTTIPLLRKKNSDLQTPPVNHSNGIKAIDIDGKFKMIYQTETHNLQQIENESHGRSTETCSYNGKSPADSVDRASRVLFPVLFVIFNIMYWSVYALPG